ncbi:MAG: helix-turn-helix domain-containing protein [bacterium]|nr:helix-turn-helix domain-containing protein [bacterium]
MAYSQELRRTLSDFGLDEKASLVYLAALELGPATVLELSRRTTLPRTTLYPILDELRRQGIVRYGKRKSKTIYTVESPNALAKLFHARERRFADLVPQLEALQGTVKEGAGVTLFEGAEGFRQIWRRIFRSGVKEYRIITSGIGLLDFVKEAYLTERIISERKRRGIRSLQLIPEGPGAEHIVAHDSAELRESRLLPAGTVLPATIIIFGEEIAYITTRRENTMVLIASGEAAITNRSVFDLLWKLLPQPAKTKQLRR